METYSSIKKYLKCEACGISAFKVDNEKTTFMARFPLDVKRSKDWVRVIGKKELANLSVHRLHYSRYVCKRHFLEKDFTLSKSRLKKDAVPSVNLFARPLSPEHLKGFGKNPIHSLQSKISISVPTEEVYEIMPNNHGTSEPDMEIIAEEIEVADTQICHKQQDNQNNVNRTDNDDEDHEGADLETRDIDDHHEGADLETRDCDDHHKSADLETRDIDDHHETTEAVENNEDKVVMEETVKSGFGGQKIIVRRRKRYMKQNDELKPLSEIIKPGKKLITVHGHRHLLPAVSGIHNELLQIGWLAGIWETHNGLCQYPTMEDFKYHQEVEFICIGQPMFNYVSKLSHPTRGTAMHQERGFLQIKPGTNQLEFMVSHNFGLTSLEQGHFNQFTGEIELATVSMTRMTFAEPPIILGFKRIIRYLGFDELQITVYMETEDTKLCKHLEAIYTKKA